MSLVSYITARDLFLSHHWQRYVAFDRTLFSGFCCGRITVKDGSAMVLAEQRDGKSIDTAIVVREWGADFLREPKAAESAPSVHEVLTVGDWVGVNREGRTVLFSPCIQHGVAAVESGKKFVQRAHLWASFVSKIRVFFEQRGFLEMTTPTLAESPGTEPFLDPIEVTIESDGIRSEKYLITSPEFHLKRGLAAGVPMLFEIAKCFRNREGGAHHKVEFHMLEWYRAFASLKEIADDVQALLEELSPGVVLHRTTMGELFQQFAEFELRPEMTRDEAALCATRLGIRIVEDDDFNDIFQRIFLEKIEGRLLEVGNGNPVLISGYPPSQAALARISPSGFADRFEVYWQGLELCNAFHELNDPSENRKRFESDNLNKVRSGRTQVPYDSELMRSFEAGVPPAGGIALGLERLFMAVHRRSSIEDVRPYLD